MSSTTRRIFLHITLPLPLLPLLPPPVHSAPQRHSSGEMHSELSELAANIPGAEMPDIYYPVFFPGDWQVTRELYAVETPEPTAAPSHAALGASAISAMRDRIGRRQSYVVRFVKHRGKVIEDRVANERAELASLYPRQHVNAIWDRDVPNVLKTSRNPGGTASSIVRDVRVMKRAFVDGPQGYGTFVSSEYARVVELEGEGSLAGFGRPPSIYGRRRIVRYRVSSVNNEFEPDGMDRIVVDYLYPPSPANAKAAVVLKYRDFLNRKKGKRGS